jgi:hypothetical protein
VTLSDALYAALLPFLVGLIVGFAIGMIIGIASTLRWLARRRQQGKPMPTYTDDTNPTPGKVPWFGSEHLSRFGWLLAIVGAFAIFASVVGLVQNNGTSSCLRSYIEQTSATNQQRADAAALDRQGLQAQIAVFREFNSLLIESVKNPPANQEQSRQDFLAKSQNWDARLGQVDQLFREAEQQRQANPVPARPNC